MKSSTKLDYRRPSFDARESHEPIVDNSPLTDAAGHLVDSLPPVSAELAQERRHIVGLRRGRDDDPFMQVPGAPVAGANADLLNHIRITHPGKEDGTASETVAKGADLDHASRVDSRLEIPTRHTSRAEWQTVPGDEREPRCFGPFGHAIFYRIDHCRPSLGNIERHADPRIEESGGCSRLRAPAILGNLEKLSFLAFEYHRKEGDHRHERGTVVAVRMDWNEDLEIVARALTFSP
jgi:hypothetical protein